MSTKIWDAYAMRYATVQRRRQELFISYDPHDEAAHMDYFVWFLRSGKETILVDTGFNAQSAAQRKRTFLRCPIESLKVAGIALETSKTPSSPTRIMTMLVTHACYPKHVFICKSERCTMQQAKKCVTLFADTRTIQPMCAI